MAQAQLYSKKEPLPLRTVDEYTRNFPLLLRTAYSLNNSATKKVVTGLHFNEITNKYEPRIELINSSYSRGLIFDIESWCKLKEKIEDIAAYFKQDNSGQSFQRIQLNEIDVVFATSYGEKSVLFTKRNPCVVVTEDDEPPKKKRAVVISIIMQKCTFDNFKNIITCIDERYNCFDEWVEEINLNRLSLQDRINNFLYKTSPSNLNKDTLKKIVYDNRRVILYDLLEQIESTPFILKYFRIVYLEMLILNFEIFYDDILKYFENHAK